MIIFEPWVLIISYTLGIGWYVYTMITSDNERRRTVFPLFLLLPFSFILIPGIIIIGCVLFMLFFIFDYLPNKLFKDETTV